MARVIVKDRKSLTARLKALMGTTVRDADIEKAIEEETKDDITKEDGVSGMGDVHIHLGGGGEKPNSSKDDLIGADPDPQPDPAAVAKKMDPAVEARFQGIETAVQQIAAAVQKLAGAGEEEEQNAEEMANEAPDNVDAKMMAAAKDSAYVADSFAETVQMAEVIAPGVRPPTFDKAAKPGKTVDALCKFRKSVLDLAYAAPSTRGIVEDLNGGKKLDTGCMTCDKVRNTFRALFVAKRNMNNDSGTRDLRVAGSGGAVASTSKIQSPADLNKFIQEKRNKKVA